jgi:hypothetical protein
MTNEIPPLFIGLDGEGVTDEETGRHSYVLLGSSSGKSVYRERGIATRTALEFLLAEKATHPKAIFVSFAFTYDVNMILKDLPRENLETLWEKGKVQWKAAPHMSYWIEWRPHKMFSVYCAGRRVKVYDVWGFYQASFIKALQAWNVGTPEQRKRIEAMKAERGEFDRENITAIRTYCIEECELLSALSLRLWHSLAQANIIPRDWHGPGAVASTVLRQRIKAHYEAETSYPDSLRYAIRCSYFGGRVEIFQQGNVGEAVNYDIRSAYPYAATFLPVLKDGAWEKTKRYSAAPYALWFLRWKTESRFTPLPFRYKGEIYWPANGCGWYHATEVKTALAAGYELDILGGWIFHSANPTLPFEFVHEYYAERERAKREGDAAEKAYKLALNSLYGKLAQGYGYEGKRPPFQSYYWAGFITATTRARMLGLLKKGEKYDPIYIATDSACFKGNPDFPTGSNLGGLEAGIWRDLFVIQNGIYHGQNADGEYARSRGFFLRDLDFDTIRSEWERSGFLGEYAHDSRRFIGIGTALSRKDFSVWQQWVEVPKRLTFSVRPKKWYAGNTPSEARLELLYPPTMNTELRSELYVPKRSRLDEASADFVAGLEQPDFVEV